jgi:Cu(I)/Ag(I) efflux system membrane fusion protein
MDLIPLESGNSDVALDERQLKLSDNAKKLAKIQTQPVIKAFAETEIRMVGKIAYNERNLNYITSWVPGRLDRLYADYTGVTVKKGDHMVFMYSPDLLAAQEELIQAKTAIESLQQSKSRILKQTTEATLIASREKLRLFGLSDSQIKEIEKTGITSDHQTIFAPVGGVVIEKNAKEGMYVKTGTKIYTIADLSQLWIFFEAYESDLPWLRYGQKLEFVSPSFPGERFDAQISFIDPVVDPQKRTIKVRANVDNKDMKLKPDMFVTGVVKSSLDADGRVLALKLDGQWIGPMHPEIIKNKPGACDICGMDLVKVSDMGYSTTVPDNKNAPLLIPTSAPLLTGKRSIVYVEIENTDGPIYEGREIELGPKAGDFYVVKSGLAEGEMVVTNGAFKLDSELQIQAKPSMMAPEGGVVSTGHQHGTQPKIMNQTQDHSDHDMAQMESIPKSESTNELSPVYNTYFKIQSALASDNLEEAKKSYSQLSIDVKEVNMALFEGDSHNKWMTAYNDLLGQSNSAKELNNIDKVRILFEKTSKTIIELHNDFGHAESVDFYLTFCPMALNNKGAYWVQSESVVNNPFYGEKMLRCGEIKETWTTK